MANPVAPVSSSDDRPFITTPINTGSRTLHRFGEKFSRSYTDHLETLANEMSPYFVGPIPVVDFLSEFLPNSLGVPSLPSFTKNMFASVHSKTEEVEMYAPFIAALNPHLINHQVYCTATSEDQAKTDFIFKIKPDCSVFPTKHLFTGTDSSAVELFIEFKRQRTDDPFVTKFPPNTTPSSSAHSFTKKSSEAKRTCGQITAYAASHMSAQYRTHVFSVLIFNEYARLIRWDRSGAIVTEPIEYDQDPHLFDFFIRFDRAPANVRGQDTTVRLANPEDIKDAVKVVEELEKSQTPLLVASVPNSTLGEGSSQYIIASPFSSPYIPVGRWTRTSVGYDIQRKRAIFMKDSWRLVLDGVPKEGDVYSMFKTKAVPNVPHCSSSGDVGDSTYHSTRTDQLVNANWASNFEHDLTAHRHYRLILDDIGKPLDSFKRSRDMVRAVYAALIAHEFAYKCGILHRDISPGNILITSDEQFAGGLLIDWDLCKDVTSQVKRPRRAARTGTWQFMAADLIVDPTINHTFVHDLESALYVVFWLSIKFLPNSWNPQKRSLVMTEVFNPPAFAIEGPSTKRDWMAQARSHAKTFNVTDNKVLTYLITKLLITFQARHICTDDHTTRLGLMPPDDLIYVDQNNVDRALQRLADHQAVLMIFRQSLDDEALSWPAADSATRQEIAIPVEAQCSSSKRSKSYCSGKGGSSQKRLHVG